MEYFILQFTKLLTMRSMVRKFNDYNDFHATMTPMSYTRRTPQDKLPTPGNKLFKIIDLDGSEGQKQLAINAIIKLLKIDNLQIMEDQHNIHELRFWVPSNTQANILKDTWAIPIEDNIARIGPSTFTGQDFLNRNRWVGKSTAAASYTIRKLFDNLDVIGVKNVYRQPSNKNKVYLAFDTEENYLKAISRGIFMDTTKLSILPVTPYSRLDASKYQKGKGRNPRSRSPSPNNINTLQTPSSSLVTPWPCPTGANRTVLGQHNRKNITEDNIADNNMYKVLGQNPVHCS